MAEALPSPNSGKFVRQGQTASKHYGNDPSVPGDKDRATDLKP